MHFHLSHPLTLSCGIALFGVLCLSFMCAAALSCPYCHGFEHRGTRWGLLVPGGPKQPLPPGALGAVGPGQPHNTHRLPIIRPPDASSFSHLTQTSRACACAVVGSGFLAMFAPILRAFGRPPISLFTNGRKVSELGLSDDQLKAFEANDCQWVEAPITRLTPAHVTSTTPPPDPSSPTRPPSTEGLKVELTDGNSVEIGMLYFRPPFLHSPLVGQLDLKLKEPFSTLELSMFQQTSNPLVYAGGDVGTPMASVANAVSSGGIAAAGCNHDLAAEDWGLALKQAGVGVKAAGGHDMVQQMSKLMEKPANQNEAVKAVNAD